jgi:hypothetical protein
MSDELVGWVDKHGVIHVERKDAANKPDPMERCHRMLAEMRAMLEDIGACQKPCDCDE